MTFVNKYTSSYINENFVYQQYARLGPHLPGICQQIPNQQPSGICPVYAKALPVQLGYIDCHKSGICGAYALVQKSTNSHKTSKSWCTSGINHHKWPNINEDGKFLQMGHWLVYGQNMTYNTGTPARKYKLLPMTELVCAWYLSYTRHILPFTNCSVLTMS